LVSREIDSCKIFLVDFKNHHPELRKRYQKVAKLAGDCGELRNCRSQILKVRNQVPQLFSVRNSAIDLVVRNIAELQKCGLKLLMPTYDLRLNVFRLLGARLFGTGQWAGHPILS
jgi:hypothetical protein